MNGGLMRRGPISRGLLLVVGFVVAALLGVGDGAAVQAQNPQLVGTVGPSRVISLRAAGGALVTKVDPGTYDIEVRDLSDEHNFHLSGPGVDRRSPIEGSGTETWTVTFVEGHYRYVCDPHSSEMKGAFTAGNPPAPPPPSKAITAKTRLVLTSGPAQKITLRTAGGKAVTNMKRGTYKITVKDRGINHNARIVAPGFKKSTTLNFVGSKVWQAKLAKVGSLRFLCDPHAVLGMKGSAKIVR